MSNFWKTLKRPFFALAPMYDVTDEAFRQMFVKYGQPDVLYTEFVSADGLMSSLGREKLSRELYFKPNEHPIVAQIFGSNPENIYGATKMIANLGFDGVEINMGCPDKAVIKQGAGSALIRTPDLAVEIIEAAKRGAGDMPVSVKTRLGYYKPGEMTEWISRILAAKPAALTVHLRTMKDMSKVPARWDLVDKIVSLAKDTGVPIIANGDVGSLEEAREKAKKHDLDGVMIGRGVFGNPWFFATNPQGEALGLKKDLALGMTSVPSITEKLHALIEHTKMFEDLYCKGETNDKLFAGHTKNFDVMKKHFRAYVKGFDGAVPLRTKLMRVNSADDVERIVRDFLADLNS